MAIAPSCTSDANPISRHRSGSLLRATALAVSSLLLATSAQAACALLAPNSYECSGVNNLTFTALGASALSVSTVTGFSSATTVGEAFLLSSSGGLTVTDSFNSTITGYTTGISATNNSSGALSITTTGVVTGSTVNGILANNNATSNGGLTVWAGGAVYGKTNGISTSNSFGDTAITTLGTVTGNTGLATSGTFNGMSVNNTATAGKMTIWAEGNVSGTTGISSTNNGTGSTSISAKGTVTGSSSNGIYSVKTGTGDTFIGAEKGVSGLGASVSGAGIYATNGPASANLTIKADTAGADVIGRVNGIRTINSGIGVTSIHVGSVAGTSLYGLLSVNGATTFDTGAGGNGRLISMTAAVNALDLLITAGTVSGGNSGIYAINSGKGITSVIAEEVTGGSLYGLLAINGAATFDVAAGGAGGTGLVTGVTAANATHLTVQAAQVTGGNTGIYVHNAGKGATRISATGTVTGSGSTGSPSGGFGIFGKNAATTTAGLDGFGLTLNAAAVSGGVTGILANNASTVAAGGGATFVTATGAVSGGTNYGILAVNGGLVLNSDGSLLNTAPVSAGKATDLTVEAGQVTAGSTGIYAYNYGSGMTRITATGAVSGSGATGSPTRGFGIFAKNGATTNAGLDGVGLTIDAAAVSGGVTGILANNASTVAAGGGATFVTASGAVSGGMNYGILAVNGGLTFNSDGTVGSLSAGTATDLTINTRGTVSSGGIGIYANNRGTGDTSIRTLNTVTGNSAGIQASGAAAINATNAATAGKLSILAEADLQGTTGITVTNNGMGDTLISTLGTVAGTVNNGIYAAHNAALGSLTVTAAKVSGGSNGIYTNNSGIGDTSIRTSGTVQGGLAGIYAATNGGTIYLHNEKTTGLIQNSLGTSTDLAIQTSGGASRFQNDGRVNGTVVLDHFDNTLTNNGIFNGAVSLGMGSNTVTLHAGSSAANIVADTSGAGSGSNHFSVNGDAGFGLLDGGTGSGVDTLTFNGVTRTLSTLPGASNMAHFEALQLLNGSHIRSALPLDMTDDPIAGVGWVGLAADSSLQLALEATGDYRFNHQLTGEGLLAVSLADANNAFSLGAANAGGDFAGTVALGQGQFALAGDNTAALGNAMLVLGAGNATTVGSDMPVQEIGALTFNGGTLIFDVTVPDGTAATSIIQTTKGLDVAGIGQVAVHLPVGGELDIDRPLAPGHANLFDEQQGLGGVNVQLIQSRPGSVQGTAGGLTLVNADEDFKAITNDQVIDLKQGGVKVAEASYDYRLSTSATQGAASDGLYVSYGLTQLNLIGTGSDALLLNLEGASGAVTDMGVKITGAGDLAIDAAMGAGGVISLSGLRNDYRGLTDVRSGSLQLKADGVLGQTSNLQIQTDARVDINGKTQSVGALHSQAGARVDFNGGNLSITGAQRAPGDLYGGQIEHNTLFGSGNWVIDSSPVGINGTQLGSTVAVNLRGGSALVLNHAQALDNAVGIGLDTAADQLIFGDLSQHRTGSAMTGTTDGLSKVVISGSGRMQVSDGMRVTLTGDNSYTGGTTIDAGSSLQLGHGGVVGSIRGDVRDNGSLAFNRADALRFTGAISGTGVVKQIGSGITVLTGANSYSGATEVTAGSLAAGVANSFSPNSAFQVAPAATLDLAGFDQTVASLNNAGVVNLGGAPGTVLTVTGPYQSNGGALLINTALGDSNSATDKLLAGSVTLGAGGATKLYVRNVGGLGALTTGNGIEVVHVGGGAAASAADAFTLGQSVKAGAYEYTLFQNGRTERDGNWYLRSTLEPTPPGPGPQPLPNYRAELPLYMSGPALASRFALAMLGSCDDRSGAYVGAQSANCGDGQDGRGVWGRVFGQTGDLHFGGLGAAAQVNNFEQHGPSYDYNVGGAQVGSDVYREQAGDGSRQIAGLYVGGGRVSGSVARADGSGTAGDLSMDGYSFGGYGIYRAAKGWYLDAVAQATAYNGITARSVDGQKLKRNGWGLAGSLEGGYPIALAPDWSLIPQAQLLVQHLSLGGGQDAFGTVDRQHSNAVYGRLGAKLNRDWMLAGGRHATSFMSLNFWHGFNAQARTNFNSLDGLNPVALKTDLGGTWGQVGLGVTGETAKNVSLSGSVDYHFGLGDQKGSGIGAKLGLTVKW